MADFNLIVGNDYSIPIILTNSDWTPYDLTNCVVFFTIKFTDKIDLPDTAALLKKKITAHTDPTQGKTVLTLTASETNIDVWLKAFDITIKTATGLIHHANRWTVEIVDSVTKDFSI